MGPKRKLESKEEFFIALMRLKLAVLLEDPSDWFGILAACCGRVYNFWLTASEKGKA